MSRHLAAALCALASVAVPAQAAPDAAVVAPAATAAANPAALVNDVIREVARLRGLARSGRSRAR